MDSNNKLQLNPVHNDLVKQFLDLTHYQLAQRLKSVRHSFSNLLTFKVRDNKTYDGDEVREMLIGLQEIVIDEIENELADSNYTSTLLIQKLLKTAEEWHLTLNTTISDLEDREKLNLIKQFDEQLRKSPDRMTITVVTQEKSNIPRNINNWGSIEDGDADKNVVLDEGVGGGSETTSQTTLTTSIAVLLKEKVTNLTKENELMKSKIKELESQLQQQAMVDSDDDEQEQETNIEKGTKENNDDSSTSKLLSKKKKNLKSLSAELADAQKQIQLLESKLDQLSNSKDNDLDSIQESLSAMKVELDSSRALAESQTEQLRHDLEIRESKLRTVQSHLLLKEKELEQKFQATTAYLNMKKMLLQKNNVIKELRQKLNEVAAVEQHHDNKENSNDKIVKDDDDNDDDDEVEN